MSDLSATTGEAATMVVRTPDEAFPLDTALPVEKQAPSETRTYYGQPVVKAPPWKWYVPAYFYFGGVGGASAVIAAACQLAGRRDIVPRARFVSTAALGIGSMLLIADLGRKARFHYMLRVFRPSSPLNVGSWLLGTTASAGGVATLAAITRWPSLRAIGDVAGLVAGIGGAMVSTYTGVVLSNTAVPVWNHGQRSLPLLFAGSAASSAAAAIELVAPDDASGLDATRRFGMVGEALELGGALAYEAEAEPVAAALLEGPAGLLWTTAKLAAGASLALAIFGRNRRAAAVLATISSLAVRFAVMEAGKASARDPHATFDEQRINLRAGATSHPHPRRSAPGS